MDKNGHGSIQGEVLGRFRVQIKILWYIPTKLVHIVVGLGRGTWGRKVQEIIRQIKDPTFQQVLGRHLFFKGTKTKMTTLAKSID